MTVIAVSFLFFLLMFLGIGVYSATNAPGWSAFRKLFAFAPRRVNL